MERLHNEWDGCAECTAVEGQDVQQYTFPGDESLSVVEDMISALHLLEMKFFVEWEKSERAKLEAMIDALPGPEALGRSSVVRKYFPRQLREMERGVAGSVASESSVVVGKQEAVEENKTPQIEAKLATLKTSNETTTIELDTLQDKIEESARRDGSHRTSNLSATDKLEQKDAEIIALTAAMADADARPTATAAGAQNESGVMDALRNELDESKKGEESLKSLNKSLLETLQEYDAETKRLNAGTAEAMALAAEVRAVLNGRKAAAAETGADASKEEDRKAGGQWSVATAMTDAVRLRNRVLAHRY